MDQAFSNLAMAAKLLGTCPVSRILSGRPARWLRMWPNNPRTVIFPLGHCTLLECLANGQIAQMPGCKLSLRSHTHAPQTPIPHPRPQLNSGWFLGCAVPQLHADNCSDFSQNTESMSSGLQIWGILPRHHLEGRRQAFCLSTPAGTSISAGKRTSTACG